jgi:primosomal protein N' (replication factor Y) (superfamily II helicase)
VSLEKIIRVGLDVPVATLFDYRVDDATDADIGCRVRVPFGRIERIGIVLDVLDRTDVPAHKLKRASELYRAGPRIDAADVELLRFTSDYYQHALGATVLSTLPTRLCRTHSKAPAVDTCFVITAAGLSVSADMLPARANAQRRLLAALQASGTLDRTSACAMSGNARGILRAFVTNGWVEERPLAAVTPVESLAKSAAPLLTVHQQAAVDAIRSALGRYRAFLLLGVTGSGKTEVYLHAIASTLAAGRQALLLVPEISLTPQLCETVAARFGAATLVALHSGLNESERLRHWVAAQSGTARIVVGTRLAVFVPMPQLGLVIVDEEHDTSFKQSEGLCYSARDLAVVRARQRNVPVVLGSATPALESYYNAQRDRYQLLELPERINARPPRVAAVDTRGARIDEGLSPALIAALQSRLDRGEQSLVFINRRGYAPVLMCHACGWLSGCERCTAQLVLHLRERELRCHHCGHERPVPVHCPECGNGELSPVGQGTQRIEDALRRLFPQARVLRIDRDSTRRKNAWDAMRGQIQAGTVDILIGTQILAKGHDFPRLTLVGVLNADGALYSADFRAAERLFALLMQVAGRAGRGGVQGDVLIQTEFPEHPLFAALKTQDVQAYAATLLAEREQAEFPPFVYQALLRAEAPQLETALAFLENAAQLGRRIAHAVCIYDPVPAPMTRLAGRERAHLLVQSTARQPLQAFLRAWRAQLAEHTAARARWSLDVDPLDF